MSASRQNHPGGLRVFHLDSRGRLVGFTDRDGETVTFAFDGDRRVVRVSDATGYVHELPWEAKGGFVIAELRTAPRSFAVAESLEALPTSSVADAGDEPGTSPSGNPVGRITTYTYDAGGRLFSIDGMSPPPDRLAEGPPPDPAAGDKT